MLRQRRSWIYAVAVPIIVAALLYMTLLRCGASSPLLRSYFKLATKSAASTTTTLRTSFLSSSPAQQQHLRMASTEQAAPCPLPDPPQANSSAPLPKLSPSDFREYNRLADMMDAYHNHFRQTWTTMHNACTANARPAGMSIRSFLAMGSQFVSQLTLHHNIEEVHIFPMLAEKMPRFRETDLLKSQHAKIHEGLDVFDAYLRRCRSGETELRLSEVGNIMNSFGEVLWSHLDDEVKELGAENMRLFWSKEEVRGMPF